LPSERTKKGKSTAAAESELPPVVAFLSDFGSKDSYVAEVKAKLLEAEPAPLVVDVTHEVSPHLPLAGAFHLLRAYRHFPRGTIFLAIVDPGVGSARDALVVEAGGYLFVGPGNGVLRWAVDDAAARTRTAAVVRTLAVERGASATFHGRDVFAPAIVSWLRDRKVFAKRPEGQLGGMPFPQAEVRDGRAYGVLLHEDHYGNLVTNVPGSMAVVGGRVADRGVPLRAVETYAAIPSGELGVLVSSHGFWEIAARETSAAARLKVKLGHGVELELDASR
jgi:S-adenosylmethionine hydrolase